eukprot:TRINITY_DN1222_c0_g1_i9.p1 TRINITY_DN1222_c0_g1~~TRINITY_DN1222_c0_g1_i9.p1  ORF type:complete len:943 (+),score=148.07 TRINITY_DN1222_c0_g1_i9:369-3197(+)
MSQVIRALLLPPLCTAPPATPSIEYELDSSQHTAATWHDGPLLVDAGPGTGKTRTLVKRIEHLLETGSTPASILALTFSNKASEEMRERLSAVNADAAIQMWVGTFHKFGLEIIRKWPSTVGRTDKLRVLDQAGSLALLEENLSRLPLRHYQNLYEPARDLVDVLRAISRCKDELISPAMYLAEAAAALAAATGDEQTVAAEKVIEVAEIYQVYEDLLREADAVDFGDLVALAATLVEENPDVREYVSTFKHVLVDEYQDVNFASARLLGAICTSVSDVWVVADRRQSIYRFRGAQPANVVRFVDEFEGSRHSLSHNYRSFAPVVRTFQEFSASMGVNRAFAGNWTANRSGGGEVTLTVSPTLDAEAEAIRDKIEDLRTKGVRYCDQVILGRTHLTLARITGILEILGVPLLYLGDLFERDEIRDLLSLTGIDAEFGGIGLLRIAALPAYQATRDDALAVIRWAYANGLGIGDALRRASEIEGLSDTGRIGLLKLGKELDGLSRASPWTLLTTWLFERSNCLAPLLAAADARSQTKLIAIYHLLKMCGEQVALGESNRKRFLDRIRRIEALNQDSSYRAIASEASDMDAVRVMTIHGAKGLEFGAVHFPALATRYMPVNRQGNRCPPPPSLAHLAIDSDDHNAEEQCLFFVGLSRAKDVLSLSRAERYTTQRANQSRFLQAILPTIRRVNSNGSGRTFASDRQAIPQPARAQYTERELTLYLLCPARYRYEIIEELRGPRTESAYLRFHNCVYTTIAWVEEQKQLGNTVDPTAALSQLAVQWKDDGPNGHPFEDYYRVAAEDMVARIANAIASETGQYRHDEWTIPIGPRNVLITPDRVLLDSDGTVRVQRIRTGKQSKSETDKPIYALLRRGAVANYPGRRVVVETFYLATGDRIPALASDDDKHLQTYADAIDGIERGNLDPKPNDRMCPHCQCYFMCDG